VITWASGGQASVVSFEERRVVARSTVPAAPGTPLVGAVEGGGELGLKVKSCRRDGDAWVIEGRPFNLARELRDRRSGVAREA